MFDQFLAVVTDLVKVQGVEFLRSVLAALPRIVTAVVVCGAGLYFSRWLQNSLKAFLDQHISKRKRHSAASSLIARLIRSLIVVFFVIVALIIVVPSFKVSDFMNVLGIGSVAIGFAFRDILQNFFAGIILILSHTIDENDVIKVGDFKGKVLEIQTRATILEAEDGSHVIVPNSSLMTKEVVVNVTDERRRALSES